MYALNAAPQPFFTLP